MIQRPLALLATAALAATTISCGSEDTGGLTGPGSCVLPPNYIDLIQFQTWRSLDLSVYIEREELERRGYSAQEVEEFVTYIRAGFASWEAAGLSTVREVSSIPAADFYVVFRSLGCPRCALTQWRGDGTGHISRGASILIDPSHFGFPGLPRFEREEFTRNTIAHEFGHVLGIVGHPALEGCLMCGDSATSLSYLGPTQVDINTVAMMYGCP